MVEILLAVSIFAASGVALLKSFQNLRQSRVLMDKSVKDCGVFAASCKASTEKCAQTATHTLAHANTSLGHVKASQALAEKAEAAATKAADSYTAVFQNFFSKMADSIPKPPRTRFDAYAEVEAHVEVSQTEKDREAIDAANRAARQPTWLKT